MDSIRIDAMATWTASSVLLVFCRGLKKINNQDRSCELGTILQQLQVRERERKCACESERERCLQKCDILPQQFYMKKHIPEMFLSLAPSFFLSLSLTAA